MGHPLTHPWENKRAWQAVMLCLLVSGSASLVGCDQKDKRASSRAAAYVNQARLAYRKNQLEDALLLTQVAIRTFHEDAQAYLLQAKIQYDLNLLEKAVGSIDLAIKYTPKKDAQLADAYLDRGIYLRALQRDELATESLSQAQAMYQQQVAASPENTHAALSLALLDHMWDNDKSALERLDAILAKRPSHEGALKLKQAIQKPDS